MYVGNIFSRCPEDEYWQTGWPGPTKNLRTGGLLIGKLFQWNSDCIKLFMMSLSGLHYLGGSNLELWSRPSLDMLLTSPGKPQQDAQDQECHMKFILKSV